MICLSTKSSKSLVGREMWERLWPLECVDGTSKIKKYIETLVCLQGNVIFFQGFFFDVQDLYVWWCPCKIICILKWELQCFWGIACHEWVDVLRCHWWHLGPVGSRGSWRLVDYPSMVWNSWMGCVPIRPGTANWISMVWSNLPWYWSIVFAFKMIPIPDPRNHWQQKQGSSSSHTFYHFSLQNWRIFLIFSTFKISKHIIHVSLRSIQESVQHSKRHMEHRPRCLWWKPVVSCGHWSWVTLKEFYPRPKP